MDADRIAAEVEAAALGEGNGGPRDDVAILVLRMRAGLPASA
jgi:hypothetical protein